MSDGLLRVDGVVVLSGLPLKVARDCALIAAKHRKWCGIPFQSFEALACEFGAAMAAAGHSDVRLPAVCDPVPVEKQPTVPVAEVADRLGISERQARRVALKLGGRKVGGRRFVEEAALRQHLDERA